MVFVCQVELLALATVLGRPLTVVQAEGQQAVTVGQELPGPALVLAYHRLVFGLGEHYNSVRPAD
jgi:OTU domain-containing protein 6